MEFLKEKAAELGQALSGLKELQVSVKGNAEVSLHTKSAPDAPKAKAELVEDGKTVNVTDLLLVGAALAAAGAVISLISDLFD